MTQIAIRPRRMVRLLWCTLFVLIGLNAVVIVLRLTSGHNYLLGFGGMFSVDSESSLPTWFSSSILLLSAILLAIIAAAKRAQGSGHVRYWTALSFMAFFLSADESSTFHERIGALMDRLPFSITQGDYGWGIPGAITALAAGIVFLPFMRSLPSSLRRRFALAAALYVGGAAGIEAVGLGWNAVRESSAAHSIAFTIEETMEMAGVLVLISALATYISRDITIRFAEPPAGSEARSATPE